MATSIENESILLSTITASELLYGPLRTADPIRRARRSAYIETVLARIEVLPLGVQDARAHAGRAPGDAGAEGTPSGPNDLWIAAQAVARGYAVATANVREFARVPGLRVIG